MWIYVVEISFSTISRTKMFVDRLLYIAIVEKLAPLMEEYISSHVYAARLNLSEDDSLIANGVNQ